MGKLRKILSIPKTVWFNLKVFPIQVAMKLPILVSYDTKIKSIERNSIVINGYISPFMIKYNIENGSDGVINDDLKKGYLKISKGTLIFYGKANFSRGASIRIENGTLSFGKNFNCNRGCFFSASKKITIGDNVVVGWNSNIRDSDGHHIYELESNSKINSNRSVHIGDNVWIAANVDILKGVIVPNNCVIGYRSCVTRKFEHEHCIIAGYPAKIVKDNISWEL